jgi:hypothetical protein
LDIFESGEGVKDNSLQRRQAMRAQEYIKKHCRAESAADRGVPGNVKHGRCNEKSFSAFDLISLEGQKGEELMSSSSLVIFRILLHLARSH